MLAALINRPCAIVRRRQLEERDEDGDRKTGEAEVATVCELQQDPSFRRESEGELSDTRWKIFFKVGEEIDSGDAVLVDGERYEVLGEPWHARNPRTQQASHVEVTARRTAGPGDLSEEGS